MARRACLSSMSLLSGCWEAAGTGNNSVFYCLLLLIFFVWTGNNSVFYCLLLLIFLACFRWMFLTVPLLMNSSWHLNILFYDWRVCVCEWMDLVFNRSDWHYGSCLVIEFPATGTVAHFGNRVLSNWHYGSCLVVEFLATGTVAHFGNRVLSNWH